MPEPLFSISIDEPNVPVKNLTLEPALTCWTSPSAVPAALINYFEDSTNEDMSFLGDTKNDEPYHVNGGPLHQNKGMKTNPYSSSQRMSYCDPSNVCVHCAQAVTNKGKNKKKEIPPCVNNPNSDVKRNSKRVKKQEEIVV